MYKITHGLVALPSEQYALSQTRNSHPYKLLTIHTRLDIYKLSFFPVTIGDWNSLVFSPVRIDTLPQFKAQLAKVSFGL